jgi:hypothetical protein
MGSRKDKIMDTVDKVSCYDDDLELVCDRCDVKISETEKVYAYKFERICEECEDNND